jgi:1-acyl-sn-glycerol-3-phosphate acyltransferase
MPTSGDRAIEHGLTGADGVVIPARMEPGDREPERAGERTVQPPPLPRPTPLPMRLVRSARVTVHIFGGLATTVLVFPWIRPPQRQTLIRRWSQQLLRMLGVEAHVHWRHDGGLPGNVLIVANHVSWLDIFVLNALQPARFIAKADLKRWPIVGRLIANAGTLFIERERRRDTHAVNRHTVEALTRGDLVAVFPEGTTSDGTGLLKFHSSLLQSIVDAEGLMQPVAIRYRTPADGHCAAPAYVGELSLLGSFWRVTGERGINAELHLMTPVPAQARHRRDLSRAAEEAIRTVLESPVSVPAPGRRADRRA